MADHAGITVVITGRVRPDRLDLARAALEAVIPQVIANEPACRGIRVHENPEDPCRLLIIEQWESVEAFTGPHMQTPHQQAFFAQAQEFLDGEPTFTFWRETIAAP